MGSVANTDGATSAPKEICRKQRTNRLRRATAFLQLSTLNRRQLPARRAAQRFYCLGPIVPVAFNRSDLTQPETSAPVRGFTYITDIQPSSVCA